MTGEAVRPVAVVLGGSGQIGQYLVKEFLDRDCQVASVSRGQSHISFVQSLGTKERPQVFLADVGDQRQVQDCFERISRIFGRMDFVVYGPGIAPDMDLPLARYALEAWDATFRVYVRGLFICFQEAVKYLAPGGHFLVLSSAVTRFPPSNMPPFHVGHYAAAKAAVNEFCKWARRDLHENKCLLSRLAPSAVDVPFHRNAPAYRRPAVMLPLDLVVSKLVNAALSGNEIDEELTGAE